MVCRRCARTAAKSSPIASVAGPSVEMCTHLRPHPAPVPLTYLCPMHLPDLRRPLPLHLPLAPARALLLAAGSVLSHGRGRGIGRLSSTCMHAQINGRSSCPPC